ncbi:MAG: ribosome silencing factor [Blastocatellia bacterium]
MTEVLQNQEAAEVNQGATARQKQQMTDEELLELVHTAALAADSKKATGIVTLRLVEITSFTDYFVICSGSSSRQVQAIADEVTDKLRERGVRPMNTEGYSNAEWVLIDYGAFVVHVFSNTSRQFYDLERLWRDAERIEFPDIKSE